MTTLSLVYLIKWFFYRIGEFLRHWYIDGFRTAGHKLINTLELLDRRVALRITLKNLCKPLYQDYTIIGYTMGFIFRFWRLVFGSVIYFFVLLVFIATYLAWAAIPIYIIYRGIIGW